MSDDIQRRWRSGWTKDLLATWVVAAVLAVLLVRLAEGLGVAASLLSGNPVGLPSSVGLRLGEALAWLEGLPPVNLLASPLASLKQWLAAAGPAGDVAVWIAPAFLVSLVPAWHIGPTLIARFDAEALRVAPATDSGLRWAGPLGPHQARAWDELNRWCFAGAGTGCVPAARPWMLPVVQQRFSVAVLTGASGVGKSHLAEALARHLDGADRLAAAGSRAARWRLRLRTKLDDCQWWRQRQPADPWDCGYLVEDPGARQRLARFVPRRATLLVADELRPDSLADCIDMLYRRRSDFRHPVRLLIVDNGLPAALDLGRDADATAWRSSMQDLGQVPVVDLSGVRFGVAQWRGLIDAQPRGTGRPDAHLCSQDARWEPLVEALDGQPILLAEAIRYADQERLRFEDLLPMADLGDRLPARQHERGTGKPPPDPVGVAPDLLRERVLSGRARHREQALQRIFGGASGADPDIYHALLVASVAQGGSASRLQSLLGWSTNKLPIGALAQSFTGPAASDWVAPIRPFVVLDEMLRRHFDSPHGSPLAPEVRPRIRDFVRLAWLLDPQGTLRTVARWHGQDQPDEFALAVRQLPNLSDLASGPGPLPEVRLGIVRAFVELATLHGGDVQPAALALRSLEAAERAWIGPALDAAFLHPQALGLPALALWMQWTALRWPQAPARAPLQAAKLGCHVLHQATRLVHQTRVRWVAATPALRAALEESLLTLLPRFAELAPDVAANNDFRVAALRLVRACRVCASPLQDEVGRLEQRIRLALASQIPPRATDAAGRSASGIEATLHALGAVELRAGAAPVAGPGAAAGPIPLPAGSEDDALAAWRRAWAACARPFTEREAIEAAAQRVADLAQRPGATEDTAYASAVAWRALARNHQDTDPHATERAVRRVADLAQRHAGHEGIQLTSAEAGRILATAWSATDLGASEAAACRVAEVAERFAGHEDFQHECAEAWRVLAFAQATGDAHAAEASVHHAARIAQRFPTHEAIQHTSAAAWQILAWAHHGTNLPATEAAVQRATDVAQRFPAHAGIQREAAAAWRLLAWACADTDVGATAVAARQAAGIARRFAEHEGIQHEAAEAWRILAWAHHRSDAGATEAAVQRVADIAQRFPEHAGIQRECVSAWRIQASMRSNSDAAATEVAVRHAADAAGRFADHADIQLELAEATRALAWAHRDTDAGATEAAAQAVADIAQRFAVHADIHYACAEAWRYLAWAHRCADASASETAARRVAAVAQHFAGHEDIQHGCAAAWQIVAWAHHHSDVEATEAAACRAADVAHHFAEHEGIQYACAQAWRHTIEAAVWFDDDSRVAGAMATLDAMCGQHAGRERATQRPPPVFARVQRERDAARAAAIRWEPARGGRQSANAGGPGR